MPTRIAYIGTGTQGVVILAGGISVSPNSTVVAGRVVVTSNAIPIAVGGDVAIKGIRLVGLPSNTATVRYGGSSIVITSGSETGISLYVDQQTDFISVDNLNKLYINSISSGNGVAYVYFN